MWTTLELPSYICERMLGFSLPVSNHVAIISYEGIHVIDLHAPTTVSSDRRYPEGGGAYDRNEQTLLYNGTVYKILGRFGGDPLLDSEQGESLLLDLAAERLEVRGASGDVTFQYSFEDLSGDWGYATFSPDSKFILLGVPYDIYIFQRTL